MQANIDCGICLLHIICCGAVVIKSNICGVGAAFIHKWTVSCLVINAQTAGLPGQIGDHVVGSVGEKLGHPKIAIVIVGECVGVGGHGVPIEHVVVPGPGVG